MHDHTTRFGLALDDDPLFAAMIEAVRAAALDVGIAPIAVRAPGDAPDAAPTLCIGRPSRHAGILGAPGGDRRIVWSGEPLPTDGRQPPASQDAGDDRPPRRAPRRSGRLLRRLPLAGPPRRWRAELLATRLVRANLEELAWAHARGAELVVTSHDRAAILESAGLPARVVPFGYHPAFAGPITPPTDGVRDLPLVTLGATSRHLRRGRWLERFAQDRDGPVPATIDGVWGTERDALLRRARVLVDVHRVPGTFVGIRLVLALAAGVAVVTERMPDPRPFAPGVTHLEAPVEGLLATARALVADEPRRAALVTAGQALLRDRLRLSDGLRSVLDG